MKPTSSDSCDGIEHVANAFEADAESHAPTSGAAGTPTGPLAGIRVLDLSLFMVGPWAAMLLGSLGADVLHVEQPDISWDQLAANVPPTINGTSIGYLSWNMNKRGVGIDLKDEADLSFFYALVGTCDVLITNMRTGVAERLGFGYDRLHDLNPRLIYCQATGYGTSGPRARQRGSDDALQALSGCWTTQGARDGLGEMYRFATQIDGTSGNVMAQAVLLALFARKRTGRGQLVEVTMLDAAATLQTPRLAEHVAGVRHAPQGSSAYCAAPDRAFECSDAYWIGVSAVNESDWEQLCNALTRPDLLTDSRFTNNVQRVKHRNVLENILEAEFRLRPSAYWEHQLSCNRVPWGSPLRWGVLKYHQQVTANNYVMNVPTAAWGRVWTGGPPWHFSSTPARVFGPPIPGIDTWSIQEEIQWSDRMNT
ncbi:MAG TPA: CoA transferase [Acidimicrobiales bacterium]|nr:CoA transferase [Acidimicrobiales bacterium]